MATHRKKRGIMIQRLSASSVGRDRGDSDSGGGAADVRERGGSGPADRVRRHVRILLFLICICGNLGGVEGTVTSAPTAFSTLDAATLRSLGISESDISSILSEEDVALEDVTVPQLGDLKNEEESVTAEEDYEVDDKGSNDGSSSEWWRDPLARFKDDEDESLFSTEEEEVGDDTDDISSFESPPSIPDIKEENQNDNRDKFPSLFSQDDKLKEDSAAEKEITPSPPDQSASSLVASQEIIVPQRQKTTMKSISSPKTTTSATALLLLPKAHSILSWVLTTHPAMRIFLSVACVQYGLNRIFNRPRVSPSMPDQQSPPSSNNQDQESEEEEGKETPTKQNPSKPNDEATLKRTSSLKNTFGWISQLPFQQQRKEQTEDLLNQIQYWKNNFDSSESKKETQLHDQRDSHSHQLEEIRTQLNTMTSTNKHLKLQVQKNKKDLHASVQTERDKANAEVVKLRKSMVKILTKERALMRERLRMNEEKMKDILWKEQQRGGGRGDDSHNYQKGGMSSSEEESEIY